MTQYDTIREALEELREDDWTKEYRDGVIDRALATLKAMEEQEPVAWMNDQEKRDDAFIFHTPSEPANPFFSIPLYTHPAPSAAVELSEEDIEDASHSWANTEPPWPGPVERTYARTVFKDGIRHITKHYTIYPKQP